MVGKNIDSFKKFTAGQLLDSLIEGAIKAQATFIHIEPRNLEVLVRYRVNGALIEIDKFSKEKLNNLTERLRTLAGLEIGLVGVPQDGRFKISEKDKIYSIRVSILPTIDGEKISINILNGSTEPPTLTSLGYWGHGLKSIENTLELKHGVILLNGPGDSGKSLSLASMLGSVKDKDIKIATIEDPVEYILPRANQTQVNHKTNLTFSTGLKTIENQDNDIVMVSELRDSETANLVFQYGMKNNLILTSMHSRSGYEAIERLVNNGITRPLIAHSLRILSSQSLVRRLCETCREASVPDKATMSLINKIYKLPNPKQMKYIHKLEISYKNEIYAQKSTSQKNFNTTETKIRKIYLAHPGGCEDCSHTGYKGLIGLYEIINISESIQKLMLSLASSKVLMDKAIQEGTTNILIDGLIKSLSGKTSITEIFRIHQEYI